MRLRRADHPPRFAEALLQSLGADREFVDDVLGDLAEEYVLRLRWDGAPSARRWYYGQALRTAPYLVRDWRRRLPFREAGSVLATILFAFAIGCIADWGLAVFVLPRLAFATTGIPLGTYYAHWVSTGDMMPWVFAALATRHTVPTAIAGYLAGRTGKRAPLVNSMLLAGGLFAWSTILVALHTTTLGGFAARMLSYVAPYTVSTVAGGVLAAILIQRRASRDASQELKLSSS